MTNTSGLIPVEFNVVVEMDRVESKTAGGIIILDQKKDRDKLAADEGTLIAVSPLAFTYENWPADARKPQVGDRVLFAQYSGRLWQPQGEDGPNYRILKDQEIVAVIEKRAELAAAA